MKHLIRPYCNEKNNSEKKQELVWANEISIDLNEFDLRMFYPRLYDHGMIKDDQTSK